MEDNTLNDTESFAVDDWDNPETVQWYNIKTGRSKDKGVVITHDGNFKVCPFLFLMISVINCYNDHFLVTRVPASCSAIAASLVQCRRHSSGLLAGLTALSGCQLHPATVTCVLLL